MTLCAFGWTNVLIGGASAVSWPPTAIEEPVLGSHLRLQPVRRRDWGREKYATSSETQYKALASPAPVHHGGDPVFG